MRTDWLIVGAGLTGVTFAERIASQLGQRVLIIDQRDHIGGNAWDEYNASGILEHKYGPHIFHTNSGEVWEYLSQFTDWRAYTHKVIAQVDGKLVPIPFNINSIDQLFTRYMAERLTEKLISSYGFGARVPILKLREAEDEDLRFLADYIYKNIFESYTRKQWALSPEDLSSSVTARVPILVSRDDRYFQDRFQAMPVAGYGAMIRRMLAHENIHTLLNTRWQDVKGEVTFSNMIFTGAIDEYFGFKHGPLPYRSLRFDVTTHWQPQFQSAAVVNYPNDYDYTRITEQKMLTGQMHPYTTVLVEYPEPHIHGKTIPYYPIPTESNRLHYKLYERETEMEKNVIFAGRLGDYQYYNMDQAVARALSQFKRFKNA